MSLFGLGSFGEGFVTGFATEANEALKNSLELKSQKYKLEANKHSLDEAYSSKDWSSSLTSTYNSSNKQSDGAGSYTNDDSITSTVSLSKNIFDGGKSFEKYRIAKDTSN